MSKLRLGLSDDFAQSFVKRINLFAHLLAQSRIVSGLPALDTLVGLVLHIIVKVHSLLDDSCNLIGSLVRIYGEEKSAVIYKLSDTVLDALLEIS